MTLVDQYDSSNLICCTLLLLRVKGFRVMSVSMPTLKMFSYDLLLCWVFFFSQDAALPPVERTDL